MRVIFLLSLTVVMLIQATEAWHTIQILPCCDGISHKEIENIADCFTPTNGCPFYRIENSGRTFCINQEATWIKERIAKGLKCRSAFRPAFKVLDEDDVE